MSLAVPYKQNKYKIQNSTKHNKTKNKIKNPKGNKQKSQENKKHDKM